MHKYGYDALNRLHHLLKDNGIVYHCEAGTLLGIVRDGGFIKHDDDIDICVSPTSKPLSEVLGVFINAGYRFVQCLEYDGRIAEFTVRDKTNIPIDIFSCRYPSDDDTKMYQMFPRWYPTVAYPNVRANNMLEFEYVRPTGVKIVTVHGAEAAIPQNCEIVLDSEFGPWKIPDPSFKSEMLKHRKMPDFCYRIGLEEALAHK